MLKQLYLLRPNFCFIFGLMAAFKFSIFFKSCCCNKFVQKYALIPCSLSTCLKYVFFLQSYLWQFCHLQDSFITIFKISVPPLFILYPYWLCQFEKIDVGLFLGIFLLQPVSMSSKIFQFTSSLILNGPILKQVLMYFH